jgi:hypothetical protein
MPQIDSLFRSFIFTLAFHSTNLFSPFLKKSIFFPLKDFTIKGLQVREKEKKWVRPRHET